jgi:hypothetical protein
MSELLRLSIVSSLDHAANFGDGTIYGRWHPDGGRRDTGHGSVRLQTSLGMSVGFAGQFLGPFTQ